MVNVESMPQVDRVRSKDLPELLEFSFCPGLHVPRLVFEGFGKVFDMAEVRRRGSDDVARTMAPVQLMRIVVVLAVDVDEDPAAFKKIIFKLKVDQWVGSVGSEDATGRTTT